MRRVGVGGAVLVAVLVSGCVPQAPVTPSPSAPTFMCTPEAGGAKAPCSEQQFQQMKAKDALYAEAEQVYRTYTAELMSLVRKGGSKSIPSSLQRLISGKELSDSVAQRLREVKEERLVFKGPDVRIVWAKRLPTRQKGGSVVAMKFCGDSSLGLSCGGLVEGSSLLLGQVGSCDLDWAWVWPGCRVVSRAGWAGSWILG